jgi:hypothetical protein
MPMRRNPCTVVALAGPAPGEVLAAVGRSMNVSVIRPDEAADADGDAVAAAAAALRQAGRVTAAYALVLADPLTAVAAAWRAMWDLGRPQGAGGFEREAARALAAWRAGQFELPDYYLVLAAGDAAEHGADFHLGPLRAARPHRVAFVAAAEPAQQAAGALHALGGLRHGPWWPDLDRVLEAARTFYPGSLAGEGAALTAP